MFERKSNKRVGPTMRHQHTGAQSRKTEYLTWTGRLRKGFLVKRVTLVSHYAEI